MTDADDPGGASPRSASAEPGPSPRYAIEITGDSGGERLRAVANRALVMSHVPAGAILEVELVGADEMADLKERHLGERAATDVLSFPIDDARGPVAGPRVLGQIAICPEVARRQARGLGRAPEEEMDLLLVHGILHVLGWDHDDAEGELRMRREESRILQAREAAAS